VPALYPAIDILEGKAVRLEQGDFDRRTVYDADPLEAARRWVDEGATRLHVVDLDGAREGRPVNLQHLERIASEDDDVAVQFGGGLRSVEAVEQALDAGAERVVIGTIALTDRPVLDAVIAKAGGQVRIAIDVRDGRVVTSGWLSDTSLSVPEAIQGLKDRGAAGFVYTSVDRDGTLEGPDVDGIKLACRAAEPHSLICSGGIGSLDDLRAIAPLPIDGVIVGKALYEGRFTVAEALEVL
jgi:phosphoribosylformimino-5-aminoimidazole carboxamide ribotide isomerase